MVRTDRFHIRHIISGLLALFVQVGSVIETTHKIVEAVEETFFRTPESCNHIVCALVIRSGIIQQQVLDQGIPRQKHCIHMAELAPRGVSIRQLQMLHQVFAVRSSELGPGQEGPEIPPDILRPGVILNEGLDSHILLMDDTLEETNDLGDESLADVEGRLHQRCMGLLQHCQMDMRLHLPYRGGDHRGKGLQQGHLLIGIPTIGMLQL
mmetsp:Transcript_62228/g.98419  ORF Transcript_62228/g.98419 Transcript_62228/m.98419 type:complete len:209 (-) Transcript_62228:722-1348(-)